MSITEAAPTVTEGPNERPGTAARVLKIAMHLAKEKNSFEFSMREVAATAGVSLRTVYESYPSKDDLMLAMYSVAMRNLADELAPAVALSRTPAEKLRMFVTLTMAKSAAHSEPDVFVREHKYMSTVRPEEVRRAREPLRDILRQALPDISMGDDGDIDMVLTTLTAHCHALTSGMFDIDASGLTDKLVQFLLRALNI